MNPKFYMLIAAVVVLVVGALVFARAVWNRNRSARPVEGQRAPDFLLSDDNGQIVRLSDLRGKTVVLYFYPKDETPGCTKEACAFRDNFQKFADAQIEVLGVSVDSVDSHKEFKNRQNLNFTLLSDKNKNVSREYGVLNPLGFASRVTFVIDKQGVIRKVYEKVSPADHATEVFAFAKTL